MSDGGGPAFPVSSANVYAPEAWGPSRGMSLRDWFAGQALTAMVAKFSDEDGGWDPPQVASNAYYLADAMLEERARGDTREKE